MKYCLYISSPPGDSQSATTALRFAEALIKKGHTISRIFFSGAGVLNANALSVTPQDENNLPQQWSNFAKANQIEMQVCVSSALKHGVIDESEAKRYGKNNHSLLPGFQLAGLGQLVEACVLDDRVIRF